MTLGYAIFGSFAGTPAHTGVVVAPQRGKASVQHLPALVCSFYLIVSAVSRPMVSVKSWKMACLGRAEHSAIHHRVGAVSTVLYVLCLHRAAGARRKPSRT